ncbi:MAG: hypothetical protein GY833_22785 [Aestuariibacter sp.]|nr:hypothetical protein [Aestuariibacter sp.]|tara:strand:+ start:211065 stop:211652 length:588 start_codon:yes stop_codon:yes gene_type:complete
MYFNNVNLLLQTHVAASDFARNKHIVFFRGDRPQLNQGSPVEELSNLLSGRADDWVATFKTSRVLTSNTGNTLSQMADTTSDPLHVASAFIRYVDHDNMEWSITTNLKLGKLVSTINSPIAEEDYTPTWFVVTGTAATGTGIIDGVSDDVTQIDLVGQVAHLTGDQTTGMVTLKRALALGELPKSRDFSMLTLPI